MHLSDRIPIYRHADTIGHETNNGYGQRFELHPTQHSYDVAFAKQMALGAMVNGIPIHIVDVGCGDGMRAKGIIDTIRREGFKDLLTYSGIDLDSNVEPQLCNNLQRIDLDKQQFKSGDIRDANTIVDFLKASDSKSGMYAVLFLDILHWLKLDEIYQLLTLTRQEIPPGTQILTSVCSVYNCANIGNLTDPNQQRRLDQVNLQIKGTYSPIYRKVGECAYGRPMTFFTPFTLRHAFETLGYEVNHVTWWGNRFVPNGHRELFENVCLTAHL